MESVLLPQGKLIDSVGANSNVKRGSKYYQLLVLSQVVLFFVGFGFAATPRRSASHARTLAAYADVNGGLKTALGMFEADCGRVPTAVEGWNVLIEAPKDGSLTNWHGPYLDLSFAPEDPWGHPYVYRFPSLHSTNGYDLYSLGPDGVSKSGGNDLDDISNWDSQPRN